MDPSIAHQRILSSIDSLKNHTKTFTRLQKATIAWRKSMEAAAMAEAEFYAALDEVGRHAHDSQFTELGNGFNNLSDCAKALQELRAATSRSLRDELVVPLTARAEVDARNVKRVEQEYFRQCTQQAETIRKAEKNADALDKKSRRRSTHDAQARANEADNVAQQEQHQLELIRTRALNLVMTEERTRYVTVMQGVVDSIKTQCNHYNRAIPALIAVINVCEPLCVRVGVTPSYHMNINAINAVTNAVTTTTGGKGNGSGSGSSPFTNNNNNNTNNNNSSSNNTPINRASINNTPINRTQNINNRTHTSNNNGGGLGLGLLQQRHGPPITSPPPRKPETISTWSDALSATTQQRKTMYPFTATISTQLSFEAGDDLEVDGEPEENWQYGRSIQTGHEGWFPADYLVPLEGETF